MALMLVGPRPWPFPRVEVDNALQREFVFDDFRQAIAFVNRVAELGESENHHPDIAIHYNRVILRWSTHTAGGITDRDPRSVVTERRATPFRSSL